MYSPSEENVVGSRVMLIAGSCSPIFGQESNLKTNFDDFMEELRVEAEQEGSEAVAELQAFDQFFSEEAEKLSKESE